MLDNCLDLSLRKMASDYDRIIRYLVMTSDEMTIIMHMVKPYSINPNPCREQVFSNKLAPFLVEQQLNIRKWPGTETNEKHIALCTYVCCKGLRLALIDLPCLFVYKGGIIPEDICFYRKEQCIFSTTIHEGLAYLFMPTQSDAAFFASYNGLDLIPLRE